MGLAASSDILHNGALARQELFSDTSVMRFGRERRPTWLRKQLAKWPLLVYKLGLGPLIASKILILTTRGRETGKPRKAALWYVKEHIRGVDVVYCFSRRGASSQWLKNLLASSGALLRIERETWQAQGQVMADPVEQRRLLDNFQEKYGRLARLLLQGDRVTLVTFRLSDTKDRVPEGAN